MDSARNPWGQQGAPNSGVYSTWTPRYNTARPVAVAPAMSKAVLAIVILVTLALLAILGVGLGAGLGLTLGKGGTSAPVYTTVAPFPDTPLYANCSQLSVLPKIVNGQEATPHSWPWVVSIVTSSSSRAARCSGGLVHPNWVVTAGHCVDMPSPTSTVLFGAHDLTDPSGTVTRVADKVIQHPYYAFTTAAVQYDIALLYFATPIPLNDRIQPACFPSAGESVAVGVTYSLAGWGRTSTGGSSSNVLLQTKLPVLPDSNCSDYQVSDAQFLCVGEGIGLSSACQGDSGSPLVFEQTPRKWKAVGVTSFVTGGGCNAGPMGFSDLTYYRDWVLTTINSTTSLAAAAET